MGGTQPQGQAARSQGTRVGQTPTTQSLQKRASCPHPDSAFWPPGLREKKLLFVF